MPYKTDDYAIYHHHSPEDPTEDFVVFNSFKCGIKVGFYGHSVESVALIEIPGRFSGCPIGLCGDCNGLPDDIKTRDGLNVEGQPDMYETVSNSFAVDNSLYHPDDVFGNWPGYIGRGRK